MRYREPDGRRNHLMAWRLALQYLSIALIAVGCAASGNGASDNNKSGGGSSSMSAEEATRCTQTGGRWNGALPTCERGAGGGGGY